MANSPDFVAWALDLLSPLGGVSARAMFGGHGLYAEGVMFGLLDDDELFLKADQEARPVFLAAGCRQWTYPGPKGPTAGGYWRPPDEAHEDPEAMLPWARLGVEAARRKAAARTTGRGRGSAGAKAKAGGARGEKAGGAREAPGGPAKSSGSAKGGRGLAAPRVRRAAGSGRAPASRRPRRSGR
jgi:DNA transformation protein